MKDSIHREPNTAGVCLRCDPLVPTCEVRKGTAPRSHKDYSLFMVHDSCWISGVYSFLASLSPKNH